MTRRFPQVFGWILVVGVLILVTPHSAWAAIQDDNLLDDIVTLYQNRSGLWVPIIRNQAFQLFGFLAILDLTWTSIKLALSQSDLSEALAEITRHVLFIGFGLNMLVFSDNWALSIVNSLRALGNQASFAGGGTVGISPSAIFDLGYELVNRIVSAISIWNPADSLGLLIAGIVIMVCFALIAALLLLALVEMFVVINGGVILLAFGGSKFTSDIAKKYFFYALSVGLKLFVMQLLIGLSEGLIRGWVNDFEVNNPQIMLMLGASVVMLAMVYQIPNILASMINGTSFNTGDHLVRGGMSAMTGLAAGAMGAAAVSAPSVVQAASKIGGGMASSFASSGINAMMGSTSGSSPTLALGKATSLLPPPTTSLPSLKSTPGPKRPSPQIITLGGKS